jgi:hypothetical protein
MRRTITYVVVAAGIVFASTTLKGAETNVYQRCRSDMRTPYYRVLNAHGRCMFQMYARPTCQVLYPGYKILECIATGCAPVFDPPACTDRSQ